MQLGNLSMYCHRIYTVLRTHLILLRCLSGVAAGESLHKLRIYSSLLRRRVTAHHSLLRLAAANFKKPSEKFETSRAGLHLDVSLSPLLTRNKTCSLNPYRAASLLPFFPFSSLLPIFFLRNEIPHPLSTVSQNIF